MSKAYYSKKKAVKEMGRGTLQAVSTDGPHSEWLGMPDYYIHTLTVDEEDYNYLSADEKLDVNIGQIVVFRYQKVKDTNRIDKRSLGLWIDPATYNQ